MRPTLVFDYDGTIHNTMKIYESAFRETFAWLVENNYTKMQNISSERIAGWLGLNSKEMWNSFLPELPYELKEEASRRVGEAMIKQIVSHRAVWYPGAEEMLNELKNRGYTMLVLSNCKIAYREAHWKEFRMERWFTRYYDCESFAFAPKTEIITQVQREYPGPYIVIGDRKSDLECANACGSPFVGCAYGFGSEGELEGADAMAGDVKDILQCVEQICEQI